MASTKRLVIYGAYGFTGRLLVEEAVRRGHRPILAGRSLRKLAPVADRYGLEAVGVSLDERDDLARLVARAQLVLHAAGPYAQTGEPMIRACIAGHAHQLDLTGELEVLRATFTHDRRAREAGVALMSGVGFDVVPSDCLALHVARRIDRPTRLRLAIAGLSSPTPGTVKSALGVLRRGGAVRRRGELVPGPLFSPSMVVKFGDRPRDVVPVPLGDLETAWRSTGIPDIETFAAQPRLRVTLARALQPLLGWAREHPVWFDRIEPFLEAQAHGPSEEALAQGRSQVWAEAVNDRGDRVESWLEGPEAYAWTARLAWDCAERIVSGTLRGALTPAQAFGADFVLGEGVTRGDA
jgi:short subunit dehydrogenase-like uncharacterized protein